MNKSIIRKSGAICLSTMVTDLYHLNALTHSTKNHQLESKKSHKVPNL
jgi:hypothetical protein